MDWCSDSPIAKRACLVLHADLTSAPGDFLDTQHVRQAALLLGVRQVLSELMPLHGSDEEESQRRHASDHGSDGQFAFLE